MDNQVLIDPETSAMTRLSLLLVLAATTACQISPQVDLDQAVRDLLAADRAFAALSEQSGPKTAFAAYMAPDGIMMPAASSGAVVGYDNVMAQFDDAEDPGYHLLWQPQFAEVAAAGDMGWTWGQYQVIAEGVQTRSGKYVNIWKMQADGRWKVRVDVGNQRP